MCIGHPCCGVHNCQTPLSSNRDRFCSLHTNLEGVCAIVGCNEPVVNDSLTCATPEHQKVEALHHNKGQSRFQLRNRLERARQTYSSSRSENTRALSQLTDLDNDIESFAIHNNGRITPSEKWICPNIAECARV